VWPKKQERKGTHIHWKGEKRGGRNGVNFLIAEGGRESLVYDGPSEKRGEEKKKKRVKGI